MSTTPHGPSGKFVPNTVHLVGSSPLSSNTEFFQRLTKALPGQLRRIPDGETGARDYFVTWQVAVFQLSPYLFKAERRAVEGGRPISTAGPIKLNPTGYDDAALASYREFCKLRDEGIIPAGVRFQVSLPTPTNAVAFFVDAERQAELEVVYEKLLLASLRKIQDNIPKNDLAIQWDMAAEFGMLEGIAPYYQNLAKERRLSFTELGLKQRIVRLAGVVDDGVELGFHFCYGDAGHKHFVEPKDTTLLTEMSNQISVLVRREINWIHMPVPKERTDAAYYAPLAKLKLRRETELYLGLVHAGDLKGTKERIAAASKVLRKFGIGTECGMGRMGMEEFEGVLEVSAVVTSPSQSSASASDGSTFQ